MIQKLSYFFSYNKTFLIIGLSVGSISFLNIFLVHSAGALDRPGAVQVCNKKANNDLVGECKKRVNACQPQNDSTCLNRAVKPGAKVVAVCRDAVNPQNCHKRVIDVCAPATNEERADCRRQAADATKKDNTITLDDGSIPKGDVCGSGDDAVKTNFDFGCEGEGGSIQDLAYAFIRFLSIGVGLVLAASIIYAGIQYTASQGNPEKTSEAKNRIYNAIIALVFYLLIFAIIQYLVPGGLFN